jgi:hypothetical protein
VRFQKPPSARVERISPTSFEVMASCRLRFSFGQQNKGSFSGTPATRLGTICHVVLDAAIQRGVYLRESWHSDLEVLWADAVAAEEARAVEGGVTTPAIAWPGFQIKRARLLQVAKHMRDLITALPPDAILLTEHPMTTRDGRLYGRPDLVIRGDIHKIIDYKSGGVTDEDGKPRAAYVNQLQLYALLEFIDSGTWPQTAHLFPLHGAPVEIDVDPDACINRGREAVELLDSFNSRVPDPQPATPAPASCRWCQYTTICADFWTTCDESWSTEVVAAAGVVVQAFTTPLGGTTVEIEATMGSVKVGPTVIKQIDAAAHASVALAVPGAAFAATGLVADARGSGYRLSTAAVVTVAP